MTIREQVRAWEERRDTVFCPVDFAAFWNSRMTAAGPVEATACPVSFANPRAVYERLTLAAGERVISARVIRPRGEGAFPTVLMFHDMGRGVRGWHHMTRFIAMGYGVVAMEHGLTGSPMVGDYSWEQLLSCYEDALILTGEAMALSHVDADRILTWGEGFGGGLAIVAAAMAGRAVRCAALNPMPGDVRRVHGLADEAGPSLPDYLELANFAPMVEGRVLLGTSLMDEVADVGGQYAVWHRLRCEKRHLTYPKYIHERINFFENEVLKFMA